MADSTGERLTRLRRPPPPLRRVTVAAVGRPAPRLVRLVLAGPELAGFPVPEPGASVRLLVPPDDGAPFVLPEWDGNLFVFADGRRAPIRTFTPGRLVETELGPGLELDVVLHGAGVAASWAARAEPGADAALSGPGRGYTPDASAPGFLVVGDESARPAVDQVLAALPEGVPAEVHLEGADEGAVVALPGSGAGASVTWHTAAPGGLPGDTLVEAVRAASIGPGVRIWAAGEAAAMQRIRRHLFEERGVPRAQTVVRGYWKHGRAGDADDDRS